MLSKAPKALVLLRAAFATMIVSTTITGCVPWPEIGSGGFAERERSTWEPIRAMQARYALVARAGGERQMPARLIDARLLLIRAQREFEGGLIEDSEQSLARAEHVISAIERDLQIGPANARPRARS